MMNKDAIQGIKDSKHRDSHPYWLWESIQRIPQLLSECLSEDVKDRAQHLADQFEARNIDRILLVGTGSSYFSTIAEKHVFESITGIQTGSYLANELLAYPPLEINARTVAFFHSHSGSTMGDPEVVEFVKSKGGYTIGVTDLAGSQLAQCVDDVFIGPGGPKLELPASRTYATGLFRMLMLAAAIARVKGRAAAAAEIQGQIDQFPPIAQAILDQYEKLAPEIVQKASDITSFFVIAAGPNYATADEAALGLSQSAGVPSQAFQVENFIHGPMQTLEPTMGVVSVAAPGPLQSRVLEVAAAVKMVGSKSILLAPQGTPATGADVRIEIPGSVSEYLSPIAYMIPLWQVAYHFALLGRGGHPDKLAMERPGFKEAMLYLTHQSQGK
ncbi:MAG: SIS domain-containing protein [Chloroflexi bacterium]|nr:SIS domain-containing protein [Anaerolineaceae bacterium]NMB90515.1 SIS domain-containing protein [Chloroflexota bacterium]